jgi:hypothetical protein
MSAENQLRDAIGAIDFDALATEFLANGAALAGVAAGCERLALWTNTLRSAEPDNIAGPFLLEMQRSSHDVAALLSTALYVPAAAAIRTACETALYYTYFRSHSAELATLVARADYYVTKGEVLQFHKDHSQRYRQAARDVGFPGRLDTWYSQMSAIVHGQLPGTWGRRLSLRETKHEPAVMAAAQIAFAEGVEVIHYLLLLTAGSELWDRFHHSAKRALLKGMPAAQRTLLGLDGK